MSGSNLNSKQQELYDLWRNRIQECSQSELTVTQWCLQKGINKQTYYRWHKRLKLGTETKVSVPEIYELTASKIVTTEPTPKIIIKSGALSTEIYTENSEIIATVLKAMSLC